MIDFEKLEKVVIIAEIGSNHDGKLDQAVELIKIAAHAGADAVKFQLFIPEKFYPATVRENGKSVPNPKVKFLKKYQLKTEWIPDLRDAAKNLGLEFLCTPFDPESAKFLNENQTAAFKIASGDLTYRRLIETVSSFDKPIILSTGMATLKEVDDAVGLIQSLTCAPLILLHCTSLYPAPPDSLNLRSIQFLKDRYGLNVGFSDHSLGVEASVAAVSLGAKVIEKHITLSKKLKGPDHLFALEPYELCEFVKAIRNIEAALGEYTKKVERREYAERYWARRGLYTASDLKDGQTINRQDLIELRPALGISAWEIERVVGQKIVQTKKPLEHIHLEDLR